MKNNALNLSTLTKYLYNHFPLEKETIFFRRNTNIKIECGHLLYFSHTPKGYHPLKNSLFYDYFHFKIIFFLQSLYSNVKAISL